MTAYLIAQLTVTDQEEFGKYEAGFMEVFSQYGGKILAVDQDPDVQEGEWPHKRTVLLEFPSMDKAKEWYHSDGYQKICKHRFAGSDGNVVFVKALELG